MHNYVVLRLAGLLVKHRENVRDGLVPEDYVRHLEYKGQEVALASESNLPIQADAARAGDRPPRRRPWQRESHQERGAAERGSVGVGSQPGNRAGAAKSCLTDFAAATPYAGTAVAAIFRSVHAGMRVMKSRTACTRRATWSFV